MAFGETLTTLRRSKGLSQEQLALELNISRQTISKWELGQSTPDLDCLSKLSDFFGVSTDHLIKGEPTVSDATVPETPKQTDRKHNIAYEWCFYLGLSVFLMAMAGITVLVICSAFKPFTAIINGRKYTKLLGFLLGTHTFWFFAILCVLLAIGISLSLFGIMKNIRPNKNK